MEITWDPNKAATNFQKHGIHFSDAEHVLFDPYASTVEDVSSKGEQRHVTVGTDALGRLLVVVFTYRGNAVRLISARCATKKERRYYEAGI